MTVIQQTKPDATTNASIPLPVLPAEPAHCIRSDAEAIETAHRLAADFAQEAALRDRERRLPIAELGGRDYRVTTGMSANQPCRR